MVTTVPHPRCCTILLNHTSASYHVSDFSLPASYMMVKGKKAHGGVGGDFTVGHYSTARMKHDMETVGGSVFHYSTMWDGLHYGYSAGKGAAYDCLEVMGMECSFELWDVRHAMEVADMKERIQRSRPDVAIEREIHSAAFGNTKDDAIGDVRSFMEKYMSRGSIVGIGVDDHDYFVERVKSTRLGSFAGPSDAASKLEYFGGTSTTTFDTPYSHVAVAYDGTKSTPAMNSMLESSISVALKDSLSSESSGADRGEVSKSMVSFNANALVGLNCTVPSDSLPFVAGIIKSTLEKVKSGSFNVDRARSVAKARVAREIECGSLGASAYAVSLDNRLLKDKLGDIDKVSEEDLKGAGDIAVAVVGGGKGADWVKGGILG